MKGCVQTKPPNSRIYGLATISFSALWGLTSNNVLIYYVSIFYFLTIMVFALWLIFIKINKRRNDYLHNTIQNLNISCREALEIKKEELEIQQKQDNLNVNRIVKNHYINVLKLTKPIRGNVSTHTISEVEIHALSVLTESLEKKDQPYSKPLTLVR